MRTLSRFAQRVFVAAAVTGMVTTLAAPAAGAASLRQEPQLGVVLSHSFRSAHGSRVTLTIHKHKEGSRYFLRATCELSGGSEWHLRMRSCRLVSSSGRTGGTNLVADGYDHIMGRSNNFNYKCAFTYRVKATYTVGDIRRAATSRRYAPC